MSESIVGSLTTLAGRYEIGEIIGRGGMAEVYLGRDTRLDRKVAIKLLRPDLSVDPKFRARFKQEAQSAARMSHPTVVRVFDAGEEPTQIDGHDRTVPYIVMEYVDGRMLRDIIDEGPLPASEAVRIVKGVLTALEYSHRAGVVHRDIKPSNIMLTPGGQIKVMDFGIARAISESGSTIAETGTILGTAQYFSPEQAKGELVDARTDLYSTGIILFELLTARPPFRADTPVAVAYQHVSEQPPTPSEIVPGISPAMESVVAKSLLKRRDLRFQNASEFSAALDGALAGSTVDVVDESDEEAFLAEHEQGALTAVLAAVEVDEPEAEAAEEEETVASRKPKPAWLWGGGIAVGLLVAILVVWVVSLGNGTSFAGLSTEVPDVVGMQEEEALATLKEAGLTFEITQVHDDSDPGTVLDQSPDAGTGIAPDSPVKLQVSEGPPPSPLPDMTGLTVDQASNVLSQNRLELGETTEQNSATVPAGVIISSSPEARSTVPIGTKVDFIISTGKVTVPDVVGMYYGDAVSLLQGSDVGFTVQQNAQLSCWGGNVTGQSIDAGDSDQDQTITITYCGGSKPPPPDDDDDDDDDDKPSPSESGDSNGNGNGNSNRP
ncbi:MAG: Stk1 family PASTA domain-containing Ser/Thr kinase [Agrococcus casei]